MARRVIRVRPTVTWTLTCPYCGRQKRVTVSSGTRRTIYCACGRMQWRV